MRLPSRYLPGIYLFRTVIACLFVCTILNLQGAAFNKDSLDKRLTKLTFKQQAAWLDSATNTYAQEDLEAVLPLYDYAVTFAWKHKFPNQNIAAYFYRRGALHRKIANYVQALSDFKKAEQIYVEEKDNRGLQSIYSAYASLYTRIGENLKALTFIRLAIEKSKELHDEDATGVSLNTMAVIYDNIGQRDSALIFYRKALAIYKKMKALYQQSLVLDNISMVYYRKGRMDSARYYNQRALNTARPLANSFLELQLLANSTGIEAEEHNYHAQLRVASRAKFISDSLQIPFYKLYADANYANALRNNGRCEEALKIIIPQARVIKEYQDFAMMENVYDEVSQIFQCLNRLDSAMHYYKLSVAAGDSLQKISETDRVNELNARFNLEEKEKNILQLRQQKSEEEEKGRLKSMIIWIASIMMVIVMLLLLLVFIRFRENRKLNRLLRDSNFEIASKNSILAGKQKEILDSINYARRIQYALLAHNTLLQKHLPDHFVLFRPKDIVSGDFYWATEAIPDTYETGADESIYNRFYLAVCDCTGHGVPGAFMSLLNISFLNEAITEKKITDPAQVFNHVRNRLIENVSQEGAQDGMDGALLCLQRDGNNTHVTYAAAHNHPVHIRNGKILECAADKMPVGLGERKGSFTLHAADVQPGDMLYLFTDGYADQFGGPRGRKMKKAGLMKILSEISHLSLEEQKIRLESAFDSWKGGLDQVDDVCVAGIRF